jgi:hypothetical protein
VGECALWARLTGPQFSAQVAAVVSLVEAPANHREATTVAKDVMAIKYSNKTSHSITMIDALRQKFPDIVHNLNYVAKNI